MWPKRAFQDQNFLPHSVQGMVIFGAPGSGFLLYFRLETPVAGVEETPSPIRTSLERFRRGLGWRFAGVEDEEPNSMFVFVVVVAVVTTETASLCCGVETEGRESESTLFIESVCVCACVRASKSVWEEGKFLEVKGKRKKKRLEVGGSVGFVGGSKERRLLVWGRLFSVGDRW